MPQDLTDEKSAFVQVMAWCRQATSHYLNQCWPRSPMPYGVTRPQWVNFDALAQASKFLIKRRQVVFLCWMQDSNRNDMPFQSYIPLKQTSKMCNCCNWQWKCFQCLQSVLDTTHLNTWIIQVHNQKPIISHMPIFKISITTSKGSKKVILGILQCMGSMKDLLYLRKTSNFTKDWKKATYCINIPGTNTFESPSIKHQFTLRSYYIWTMSYLPGILATRIIYMILLATVLLQHAVKTRMSCQ